MSVEKENQSQFKTKMNSLDLTAEAVLDSAIQFPNPLCAPWDKPKAVFLTGATGFLGAYLLNELLQQTDADIYCLIRSDDLDTAKQRLQQQLEFYALWQQSFSDRIIPVIGDLSQPKLALSEQVFSELAGQLDVIYHNGAQVNAMYPYDRLKASNVLGTQEILRLAGLKQTKPVHFISTLAVFFSDSHLDRVVVESDVVADGSSLKGGYKQSKWVAEELIKQAQERGLPATIMRCGRIWGCSETGIMDRFNDLLCNIVQCGIHLGAFPDVETTLNIVPVDYVSQAIVNLGLQKHSAGETFHLYNSHSISWQNLWQIIGSLGYPLEKTSYPNWTDKIKIQATVQRKIKLYSIVRHLLRSPIYLFAKKPQFDASQTQKRLVDAGIVCPPIDMKIMATYLSYFQQSEYIPVLQTREKRG